MPANLTEAELELLKQTKSETEWNAQCDAIKSARDGQYPPDWYPLIVLSGLFARIRLNW